MDHPLRPVTDLPLPAARLQWFRLPAAPALCDLPAAASRAVPHTMRAPAIANVTVAPQVGTARPSTTPATTPSTSTPTLATAKAVERPAPRTRRRQVPVWTRRPEQALQAGPRRPHDPHKSGSPTPPLRVSTTDKSSRASGSRGRRRPTDRLPLLPAVSSCSPSRPTLRHQGRRGGGRHGAKAGWGPPTRSSAAEHQRVTMRGRRRRVESRRAATSAWPGGADPGR